MKVIAAAAALVFAVTITGCGGSDESAPPPPDYAKLLAGSPPPLASLHEQESQLLSGGNDAFEARIADLKGFPIVVNVWASWCGPCRAEFPFFQELSAKMGKKVAFVGVNSEDADDLAQEFLADYPVPYPSYKDGDGKIADGIDARYYPATAFYDKDGNLVTTHVGGYTDQESLAQAIQKYAVKGQSD